MLFNPEEQVEQVYEAPAVIYDGLISTRAGSPIPAGNNADGVDPADLFD